MHAAIVIRCPVMHGQMPMWVCLTQSKTFAYTASYSQLTNKLKLYSKYIAVGFATKFWV